MKKRLFISHITEERIVAEKLKQTLIADFLGLLDVFVSSDTESIAAGELWLQSIEVALRDCAVFVALCSPESIHRPWINFEAGAAWMRDIPLIPVCHAGLLPHDLRMPLSLKQGIRMDEESGLRRLYSRIAEVLGCDVPRINLPVLTNASNIATPSAAARRIDEDRGTRKRIADSLANSKYRWRTLDRVAAEAALSQEQAADLLRSDENVRFSKGKRGSIIVGLRSRVG